MTTVRPRALQHRGRVRASAFLLSSELLGPHERLARALELFEVGVQVHALSTAHWLVRLPYARSVTCEAQRGTPLTATATGHLAAAPLSARELEGVDDLHGPSVLWLRGGVLHQTPIAQCLPVDLTAEIVLPELHVVELHSLTDPLSAIAIVEPPPPRDLRELLSDHVPAASEAQKRMLEALSRRTRGRPERSGRVLASVARALDSARRTAVLAGGWLARMRAALRVNGVVPRHAGHALPAAPAHIAGPSVIGRAWSALARALATLAARSPLGTLLGFRQARYLRDMLRRFESGDLAEALRHAIPLSATASLGKHRPALGTPNARSDLTISPWRAPGSIASYMFGDELYDHLRNTYLAAAKRFEAQDRLHEAAFVYAELLDDPHAAIAILERAGAFRMAAELAEGRKLGASTIVRLWFLAKEVDRAVDVATRHDSFTTAIHELAVRDRAAADALRLTWATRLASAGRYVEAVDAIWPVDAARHVADRWLMNVIAQGGVPAARALARALRSGRGELAALDASFRAQVQGLSYEAARCRIELARQLVEPSIHGGASVQRYLPSLTRALVADVGAGTVKIDARLERALVRGVDRVLVADLPNNLAGHASRRPRLDRSELRWQREDVGALAIHHAVRIASGGYALALGEMGIRVLTHDGRRRTHFAQPAEELVLSDSGAVAIAIAPRGALRRLAHVDFVRSRAERWTDMPLDAYARDYDGDRWFVQSGKQILCLDTQRTDARAVWHVRDDSFLHVHLARTPKELLIVADLFGDRESWRYELPSLTFRRRTTTPRLVAGGADVLASDDTGTASILGSVSAAASDLTLSWAGVRMPLIETAHLVVTRVDVTGARVLVTYHGEDGLVLDVVSTAPLQRVLRVRADGASVLRAQADEHGVIVADDRGRLLHYDLQAMNVVSDLRLFV